MSFDLNQQGNVGNVIVSNNIMYKCIQSGSEGNAVWEQVIQFSVLESNGTIDSTKLATGLKDLYNQTPAFGASSDYQGFQGNAGVLTLIKD